MPKTKKKEEIIGELSEKQLAELQEIDKRLKEILDERGTGRSTAAPVRMEKQFGSLTLRYETVRCGKENCSRCPHGPYWYAYWKEGGRTHSRYIGRSLPTAARESYEEKRRARLSKEE